MWQYPPPTLTMSWLLRILQLIFLVPKQYWPWAWRLSSAPRPCSLMNSARDSSTVSPLTGTYSCGHGHALFFCISWMMKSNLEFKSARFEWNNCISRKSSSTYASMPELGSVVNLARSTSASAPCSNTGDFFISSYSLSWNAPPCLLSLAAIT